ncbi:MAG: hypothetical protein ONB46_00260 [candidate division KSB1 bacterium]|nr:hypothetical protein [candidate division KSB1 bacterium]MDZ7364724.1 hypothetical protein [candidate division KSB1 bacterium]MDZ7402528.1 hypothetical protein [candidate division KSB1 bacterium]
MRKTLAISSIVCGSIFIHIPIHAQPKFQYPVEKASFGPRLHVQTWRLKSSAGDSTITAVFTPLRATIPLFAKFDLDVAGAAASTSLKHGSSQTLQGLADAKIRGVFKFNDYHWLVHFGLNLPTGKNILDAEEARVNNLLSETVLSFPLKRYGRGLEADWGAAYAFAVSENLKAGLGAGFLLKGEYAFLESNPQRFDPGDEISVTGGLDFRKNSFATRWNVLVKLYQKDRLDGQEAFQEGTQLETEGLITFPAKKLNVALAFKNVIKADNKTYAPGGQIVSAARDDFSGNIVWSSAQATYNFSERLSFASSFGLSLFGKSQLQLGEAQLYSLGGGLQFKSSEHLMLNAAFSHSSGDAKNLQGTTVDLQGFLFVGGLSFRY